MVFLLPTELNSFCRDLLTINQVRYDVAARVADGLVLASHRGVDSHGVRLLPHYIRGLKAGRINPNPEFRFDHRAAATGQLDGDHTFGHAAGAEGMKHAMELARNSGMGAVAVSNSSHFGAAAYFSLMAAKDGLIGLSFTHADSLMQSHGSRRAFFGTNPICFAAPCMDDNPFCLDMATTTATWNKVLREGADGHELPEEWGADADGIPTTDPKLITMLNPMGGYKGFGLGMMVDVLCSLLTGMPYGRDITRMYDDPIEERRNLGHFFMAFNIAGFTDPEEFKQRMQLMMDEVRAEPPQIDASPVQVAGDPENAAYRERSKNGIPLSSAEWSEFSDLANEYGINLPPLVGENQP
jgi:ureidoglycolate dehydrogenase (NAD+)